MKERLVQVLAKEAPLKVGMDNIFVITTKRKLLLRWYVTNNARSLYYFVEEWQMVTDLSGREMCYINLRPESHDTFMRAIKRATTQVMTSAD